MPSPQGQHNIVDPEQVARIRELPSHGAPLKVAAGEEELRANAIGLFSDNREAILTDLANHQSAARDGYPSLRASNLVDTLTQELLVIEINRDKRGGTWLAPPAGIKLSAHSHLYQGSIYSLALKVAQGKEHAQLKEGEVL